MQIWELIKDGDNWGSKKAREFIAFDSYMTVENSEKDNSRLKYKLKKQQKNLLYSTGRCNWRLYLTPKESTLSGNLKIMILTKEENEQKRKEWNNSNYVIRKV